MFIFYLKWIFEKDISKVGSVLKRICALVGHTKMDIHESIARIDSGIDSLLRVIRDQAAEIVKLTDRNRWLTDYAGAKVFEVDALRDATNEDVEMWNEEWWSVSNELEKVKADLDKRNKENEVLKNKVRQLKRGPTRSSKRLKAKATKRLRTK